MDELLQRIADEIGGMLQFFRIQVDCIRYIKWALGLLGEWDFWGHPPLKTIRKISSSLRQLFRVTFKNNPRIASGHRFF